MFLVALLWGVTNPLLRLGTKDITKVKCASIFHQIIQEIIYLIKNWRFTLPFLLNQCGSVFYYITLGKTNLSITVPVVNSMTFVVTVIVGYFLGEKLNKRVLFGSAMITFGVTLCIVEKTQLFKIKKKPYLNVKPDAEIVYIFVFVVLFLVWFYGAVVFYLYISFTFLIYIHLALSSM